MSIRRKPPSFFSKTSPGIFIVAWWLWRPRVSTRNVPCWTKPWRSRGLDGGFSFWACRMCWLIWWDFSSVVILLNGPLEKTERVTLVLCAKCQISVGKRHKWSAIWKEMQPENCLLLWRALCTRSSSTTGGWTHQRPLRRASLREIRRRISQSPESTGCYGGVNAKPSIFMFWMLLQTLPVPIFIFLEPNRWSWRWPLPWEPWRETHKAATCWGNDRMCCKNPWPVYMTSEVTCNLSQDPIQPPP